tara:strand:- start:346 stop:693 length:348 start_codon:yes stop_codon:yes gene_type:complete
MESIEHIVEALKITTTVAILFVWFVRYDNIKKEFAAYGYPTWFRDLIGILKISFTTMLHSNYNEVVLIGSTGILILMTGAVITHIKVKSEFRKYIASVSMFTISSIILIYTASIM